MSCYGKFSSIILPPVFKVILLEVITSNAVSDEKAPS